MNLIGLVTEEELKTPRIRRFQKKVIPTLNSLEGNIFFDK